MNNLHVCYIRRSQDREDKQVLSIPAQKVEMEKLAKDLDLVVSTTLSEDKSAKRPGRPGFNTLKELISDPMIRGIVCWKLSRLSRNAVDGAALIQAFDDGLIDEIVTPGRIYRNTADDKFWMMLEFGMAKKYIDDLSDNTKRGLRQALLEGRPIGPAPVGYLNIDEHGKIAGNSYDKEKQRLLDSIERPLSRVEIDPICGPLVVKLFELASTGDYCLRELAMEASTLGLRSKFGNVLGKSSIQNILTNPFYEGILVSKGVEYAGSYLPLITEPLFNKVQIALGNRSRPLGKKWNHAYKDLMKCPCGCSVTATTKVKVYKRTNRQVVYTYYHCTKRKGPCNQPWVTKEDLEEQLEKKISAVVVKDEILEICLDILKAQHKSELEIEVTAREQNQRNLNVMDRKLKRLLDLRIEGEITEKEYADKKGILLEEKYSLEGKLSDSSGSVDNWLERVENFFKSCNVAHYVFKHGNLKEKHNLVKSLGWNLLLDDGKLTWNYRKPFDVLVKPVSESFGVKDIDELRSIWLGTLDMFRNRQIDLDFNLSEVENIFIYLKEPVPVFC